MKKFFVVLLFSAFMLSFSPFTAEASQNLVTTDSAIAVSLYSELKNSGYDITVPYPDSDTFQYVMQPLVDAVLDLGEGVVDAFAYLGESLYYDVDKVRGWITSLFGSGDTGSFSVSGSLPVDIATYNRSCANVGIPDYGSSRGYPLLSLVNDSSQSVIPVKLWYYDGRVYPNTFYGLRFEVYGGVSGSQYYFYCANPYSNTFYAYDENFNLYNVYGSYSGGNQLGFLGFDGRQIYNDFWYTYYDTSLSLNDTFLKYYAYVKAHVYNFPVCLVFNGNEYWIRPESYHITRPSNFVPPTNHTYRPITYQYVTQNFGSADTIYNNYYSGSETGSINTDDIIAAINRVDSSVVTGAAAIVSAIQGLEFLSETNNSIVNNYDFHLGDLNISAGITSAANEVDSAFSDLTSGDNGGVAKIGADFISVVPSDIAVVLFGIIGASIIALVINKMRS